MHVHAHSPVVCAFSLLALTMHVYVHKNLVVTLIFTFAALDYLRVCLSDWCVSE